jgi:hypothetical protein
VLSANAEVSLSWKNASQQVLVFVVRRPEELGWARSKDVTNLIYDLYVAFYDSSKKLLFIHSSTKSRHAQLARALGGAVTQVRGEAIFRVLGGLERILFYNAGLLRNTSGAVRFQMFAGLDVARAIDPVEQQESTKSNRFGAGYEDGRRVTIGCSRKGIVWSLQTSSIPDWVEWCRHIGAKLVNNQISTTQYLDHTLVPEVVSNLPIERPLCIEWPPIIFERITKQFEFQQAGKAASWLDCDLDLSSWNSTGFEFVIGLPDGTRAVFRLILNAKEAFEIGELPTTTTYIKSAELAQSSAKFFEEHPPLLRFQNGAELLGNILIKPRTSDTHQFRLESLVVQDWTGVDITRESKWRNGVERPSSVQQFVISQLLADQTFGVIIDDDDTGEAADVLAVRDAGECINVYLVHCKFSDAQTAGSRADDLYVVCGQAEKSVMWTSAFDRLVEHIIHRERKTLNGRPTRFERGSLKELTRLRRVARQVVTEYSVIVVQPGVSKSKFTPEHSAILGATSLFLRQRLNTELKVWVSP